MEGGDSDVKDVKEVRRPFKSWIFKGIVMRPIFAIIVVAVMLTIIFVGPNKVSAVPDLKQLQQEDLLSSLLHPAEHVVMWTQPDFISYIKPNSDNVTVIGYNTTTNQFRNFVNELDLSKLIGRRIKLDQFSMSYDAQYILLALDTATGWDGLMYANYLIYSVNNGTYVWIGDNQGAPTITNAQWSPTGHQVAYVSMDDVWVYDVELMLTTRITSDGYLPEIINGRPGWMYRIEIFTDNNCIWWSPDGTKIAILRTNNSLVPTVTVSHSVPGEEFPVNLVLRYPTAGTPNPAVSVLVIDTYTNITTYLPFNDEYITAVTWISLTEVLYRTLNRSQNCEHVLIWNANTNTTRSVLTQYEPNGWIPLNNILYLGNNQLAIIKNFTGNYHVHTVDLSGNISQVVTSGKFDVTQIAGYNKDTNTLYYMSTEVSSLGRDLYAINLNNTLNSKIQLTTKTPAYNSVIFNQAATYFILNYEGPDTPIQSLYKINPDPTLLPIWVTTIEDNSDFFNTISGYYRCSPHYTTIAGSDGSQLNVQYLIPPKSVKMTKPKYGLLIHADGRPGSQSANYKWQLTFDEFIASTMGIVVARVDPQGTANKGCSFLFKPRLQLGTVSTKDYITAAKNLPLSIKDVNIDPTRVAIWGSGMGGYHALRSLIKTGNLDSNVLKGAITVDPIIDWKEYESFFTEQVMLTPTVNPTGYNETRILTYINSFANAPTFLLISGTENNDIYGHNSQELKKALTTARVAFQTMYYTDWYDDDKVHFYKVMSSYIQQLIT